MQQRQRFAAEFKREMVRLLKAVDRKNILGSLSAEKKDLTTEQAAVSKSAFNSVTVPNPQEAK